MRANTRAPASVSLLPRRGGLPGYSDSVHHPSALALGACVRNQLVLARCFLLAGRRPREGLAARGKARGPPPAPPPHSGPAPQCAPQPVGPALPRPLTSGHALLSSLSGLRPSLRRNASQARGYALIPQTPPLSPPIRPQAGSLPVCSSGSRRRP